MMNLPKEWHALGREAELAAGQIAAGVTALGRANYGQKGYYTQAFFGLSIGLERLGKLIVLADYAIEHSGGFPSDSFLKQIGHDLQHLLDRCGSLSQKYRSCKPYAERPNDLVHQGIVQTLTEFAKLSRYYNLDLLSSKAHPYSPEPIFAWWQRVGEPILRAHYSERMRQKDAAVAEHTSALFGSIVSVLHHAEDETTVDDIEAMMRRSASTRVVQKYGRLYCIQLVRWLAFLINDLSNKAAYDVHAKAFLGLGELFVIFRMDDHYLRTRRTWSINRL